MSDVMSRVKEAVNSAMAETGFTEPEAPTGTISTGIEETKVEAKPAETPETPETPVIETEEEQSLQSKPKEKEEKVEPEPETDEEEDFRATAEELELIDKDPALKKVYRSLQRGFTEKTTKLATLRKEAEGAMAAIEEMRLDLPKAARGLAAAAGLKIAEEAAPPQEITPGTLEAIRAELEPKIGKEAADILAPSLHNIVEKVMKDNLSPIQETLNAQEQAAKAQELRETISDFGKKIESDGGEWNDEVEREMATMVGKIRPGKDKDGNEVTLEEYMEFIHNNVEAVRSRKRTTVDKVERLRKAQKVTEPVRASKPVAPASPSITPGMNMKDAAKLAVEAARKELSVR